MATEVSWDEFCNDPDGLLRSVEAGESIAITHRGQPVADLVRHRPSRPRWLEREELIAVLETHSADAGLRDDLERIAGDTTDDLGPIL